MTPSVTASAAFAFVSARRRAASSITARAAAGSAEASVAFRSVAGGVDPPAGGAVEAWSAGGETGGETGGEKGGEPDGEVVFASPS
jgi:hypothetical protein